ncbi:putative iron-regulated protein [Erysiphe necator]|uniref:Putative iron-regulated protein n=1 Tax=Uncinula necator TaxID=52586 RepID=A0A0B1PBB5_UNCNE|nr:putative iron-regulated protein [Erysiphe necator]
MIPKPLMQAQTETTSHITISPAMSKIRRQNERRQHSIAPPYAVSKQVSHVNEASLKVDDTVGSNTDSTAASNTDSTAASNTDSTTASNIDSTTASNIVPITANMEADTNNIDPYLIKISGLTANLVMPNLIYCKGCKANCDSDLFIDPIKNKIHKQCSNCRFRGYARRHPEIIQAQPFGTQIYTNEASLNAYDTVASNTVFTTDSNIVPITANMEADTNNIDPYLIKISGLTANLVMPNLIYCKGCKCNCDSDLFIDPIKNKIHKQCSNCRFRSYARRHPEIIQAQPVETQIYTNEAVEGSKYDFTDINAIIKGIEIGQTNINEAVISNETVPHETVPHETVPQETVSHETVPHETVPHETVPQETVPHETAPLKTWIDIEPVSIVSQQEIRKASIHRDHTHQIRTEEEFRGELILQLLLWLYVR